MRTSFQFNLVQFVTLVFHPWHRFQHLIRQTLGQTQKLHCIKTNVKQDDIPDQEYNEDRQYLFTRSRIFKPEPENGYEGEYQIHPDAKLDIEHLLFKLSYRDIRLADHFPSHLH